MGYKVTFESGHVVNFDNEPTQSDIDEVEQQLTKYPKKSKSLVEQIPVNPGIQASNVQQTDSSLFRKFDPNMSMLDAGLAGAKQAAQAPLDMLETVASVGSMMTSGMAGGAAKAYNAFATGQDPEKAFHEGIEALTYQPRLPGGQELTGQVNKGLTELMPLAGHTGGFHIPLRPTRPLGNVKPTATPTPETTPINVDPIYKKVKESIDTEYKNAKADVAVAERRGQKGTTEWDSLMSAYLEADLNRQKINKELGIAEDFSIRSDQELINQREAFIERTRSGKQLSDVEIEVYDNLMIELDKRVKLEDQKKQKPVEEPVVERPVEPTERPVEAIKAEEPIPEPIRTAEKPYEWDRSQEWKSESTPDEGVWNKYEEIAKEVEQNKANARLKENALEQELTERFAVSDIKTEQRAPFKTKEELHAYLDRNIDIVIKKLKRVQDLLNWAKDNNVSEVPLKNKKVTTEDLINARENLQKELEGYGEAKNKSNLSTAEMESRLADPIRPNIEGPKYSADSISRRLKGLMRKYETTLERLGKSLSDYEDGRLPSGSPVFRFKDKEYGYDAALQLQKELTDTYESYRTKYENAQNAKANLESFRERTPSDNDLPT